jgi:D,D-heptose 1,7-bisphosphate phosphatase
MKQLVILAGGRGTRLGDALGDNPKPMVPVAGRPLLEYHIDLARRHGFAEVILLTGYRSEKIERHFGDGSSRGITIRHVIESEPLGTAGALVAALPLLAEEFCVLYGDTMLDVDLDRMSAAHHRTSAAFTLFVHPNDHPADSDLVETDDAGRVRAIHPYPHAPGTWHANLVNAALYVVRRDCLLRYAGATRKFDIAKHLLPELIAEGQPVFAYRSREYIKDMGTPERLQRVGRDLESGKVHALRIGNPRPAVFLDRDGTLNVERNRIARAEDLELLPEVAAAVRRLNRAGWLAPVITNQPVIARGDCTEAELDRIHAKLEWLLGEEGAFVDGVYYCPHHPHRGYPGERPELKVDCECRKPKTGLLQQAVADLNIDLANSWFVGDSTTDVRCARTAGVKAGLVLTGHAGRDGQFPDAPDATFANLAEAVEFILAQPVPLPASPSSRLPESA